MFSSYATFSVLIRRHPRDRAASVSVSTSFKLLEHKFIPLRILPVTFGIRANLPWPILVSTMTDEGLLELSWFLEEWASEVHRNDANSFLSQRGLPYLPSFSGINPEGWIDGCVQYFKIHQSVDIYRFSLMAGLLVGKAKVWFSSWSLGEDKEADWVDFLDALCENFTNKDEHMVYEEKAADTVDLTKLTAFQVTHAPKSTLTSTVLSYLCEYSREGLSKVAMDVDGTTSGLGELFETDLPSEFAGFNFLDGKSSKEEDVKDAQKVFGEMFKCGSRQFDNEIAAWKDAQEVFDVMLNRGFVPVILVSVVGGCSASCFERMVVENVGLSLVECVIGDGSFGVLVPKVKEKRYVVGNMVVLREVEQSKVHGGSASFEKYGAAWNETKTLGNYIAITTGTEVYHFGVETKLAVKEVNVIDESMIVNRGLYILKKETCQESVEIGNNLWDLDVVLFNGFAKTGIGDQTNKQLPTTPLYTYLSQIRNLRQGQNEAVLDKKRGIGLYYLGNVNCSQLHELRRSRKLYLLEMLGAEAVKATVVVEESLKYEGRTPVSYATNLTYIRWRNGGLEDHRNDKDLRIFGEGELEKLTKTIEARSRSSPRWDYIRFRLKQDAWVYSNGKPITCTTFILPLTKAAGRFGFVSSLIQNAEFIVRVVYLLKRKGKVNTKMIKEMLVAYFYHLKDERLMLSKSLYRLDKKLKPVFIEIVTGLLLEGVSLTAIFGFSLDFNNCYSSCSLRTRNLRGVECYMENVQDIEARHISDNNSNTRQDNELNQASKHEETTAYVIVNEEDLISMLLGYLEELLSLELFSHTVRCFKTRLKPLHKDLDYTAGQSEVGSDLEAIEEATIFVGTDALTWTTIPAVIDQDEATVMFERDFTDMGQPCVVVALINWKAAVGVFDCCSTNLLCTVVDPCCSYGVGGDDVVIAYKENVDQDVVLLGCDFVITADAQMNFAIEDDGLNSDRELRIAICAGLESGAKIITIFINVVWEINRAPKTLCSSSSLRTRNLSGKGCCVENSYEFKTDDR